MLSAPLVKAHALAGEPAQALAGQADVERLDPKRDPGETMVYQIRVKGHLGPQWTDWFEGLTITLEEDGDTLLTGPVVDQAALYRLAQESARLGNAAGLGQLRRTRTDRHIRRKGMNTYRTNAIAETLIIGTVAACSALPSTRTTPMASRCRRRPASTWPANAPTSRSSATTSCRSPPCVTSPPTSRRSTRPEPTR